MADTLRVTDIAPDSVRLHAREDLDAESALRLYQAMLTIRTFEERALALCSAGEISGVVHPYIGHEAIAVGVCSILQDKDLVASYYRGHGHAIAKGVDPARMMAEMFGRATGLCRGRGGSMHLADWQRGYLGGNAVVGANVPIALGLAIAAQVRRSGQIVVVFFGDGATGSGIVLESFGIASAQRLPILFICENNLYQDLTRSEIVSASTGLVRLGAGHLIPTASVDGNDVVVMRRAAISAVDYVRRGEGPMFIEAHTYLLCFHSQIGRTVPPPYRPQAEVETWELRDPIRRFEAELRTMGVNPAVLDSIAESTSIHIDDAVAFARRSPAPQAESAFGDVFTPGDCLS